MTKQKNEAGHQAVPVRWWCLVAACLLVSCGTGVRPDSVPAREMLDTFRPPPSPWSQTADVDEMNAAAALVTRPAASTGVYRIGPGDLIRVHVAGHEDLSTDYEVGPDGRIGFPLVGTVELGGDTRDEAAARLVTGLEPFLSTRPVVAVDVTQYENNKVYVLGRVEQPGEVVLTGRGTLLQALASVGGLPVREFRAFLSRAAIIRGNDEILWIDLIDLLQRGNASLNVPLVNGDVVFIPDAEDATVFVMGSVGTPGAVPIKARIRLTQALAIAGGTTEDADLKRIYVLRPSQDGSPIRPAHVDLARLIETGDFTENLELRTGDVVYVARSGMGDVGYTLRKLAPGAPLAIAGAVLASPGN